MMRGDLALQVRLLLRPQGLTGLVAAVAGLSALAASYLPWYEVEASVAMLGTEQSRAVAHLAGWHAHPWTWVVPAAAVVAVVVGAALAVDHALPRTRDLELGAGLLIAAAVGAGGLVFPPVSRFDVAGTRLRELAAFAGRLPDDVTLDFAVRPGIGLWLTLAASFLLVAAAFASREIR